MDQNSESYEFLDLSDVNDNERKEIIKTLYQQQQPTTRTTTVTTTTTSQLQQQPQHQQQLLLQPPLPPPPQPQHSSSTSTTTTNSSTNFHPQIVFFPPPQQHFYIHPQFDPSFLHQNNHHHFINDQQQSSTSASETTSIYRSSSVSNCSDSTSDCVTPSGSVLNLNDNCSASSNNKPTTTTVTVRNSNSTTNRKPPEPQPQPNPQPAPPTYSAVVYGGVSRGGGGSTISSSSSSSVVNRLESSSSTTTDSNNQNGLSNQSNKQLDDDYDNHHHRDRPRHFRRYVKTTHVDHSTQNTKGKSSGSNNTRSSTTYSANSSVGSSASNMPQQQQSQSQQQVATQPQNVPQSNNNQPSNNGNSSGSNSVSNFHPHGGYGAVPYAVHHGGHSIYPAVINAALPPGNVFVNNVTANVNVKWSGHPGVQAAYIPNSQSYITAGSAGHPVEVVGDQTQVMQPVHMSMPVRNRAPYKGRMRAGQNSNNSRRSEYTPRQQQDSPNPQQQSSQQRDRGGDRGGNSNNMPPSQPQQQQPPQQMDSGNQATMAYPYAYQYSYPAFYGPQGLMHSQAASAAQNVTGAPIYVAAPYIHHPMYNYPVMYSQMMPQEFIYEDNGETVYYTSIPETDINHNPAPGETPAMLSPAGYAPIYEQQMHEMHQQMNAIHIYDQEAAQPQPHMVGPIVDIEQGAEGIQLTEQILSPHEQEVGPGQVPQEGPYILAPVAIDNQLNNSGSDDQSILETMSHHSNEIMIPMEMAPQIQQVPVQIPVPFIQPMEAQPAPVTYEPVADHQPIPVVDPVTKEVVTIVGRDFNQNQMPNVRMNMEPEIQQVAPIESISFQQNIIEENNIEEVSIQLDHAAVQIESTSINSNHVDEIPVIPNIPDGTMVHTTITKSMSWTNHQQQHNNNHHHHHHHQQQHHQSHQHHYNKKSTASVAVTATPTPSNGKPFTPSIKHQTASTTTTPSPQVKNHGAMKTPSSPVGVQSNSSTKGTTTSTSTASATAIPQQLQQEPKKPHKSQGPLVFTPPITNTQPQSNNSQQSWASLFVSSPATTNYTTSSSTPVVPPTQNNTSSSTSNTSPALPTTTLQSANNATTATANATATTTPIPAPTKPVAKVAPYESGAVSQPSPVAPQPQQQQPTISNHINSSFSTNPGALSYSAASTQSLSPAYSGGGAQSNHSNAKPKPQSSVASTVNNKAAATAATVATVTTNTTTITANHKNQTSNVCGDEWSIKLAKFLTKYKTDFNAVSLKPRGMMNKSNYCYINSILQALIGCPPFYNLLKNLPKQPTALQTEVKTPTLNAMVQLASEFSTLPPGARLNFNKREKVQKDGRTLKDDNGGTDLQCDSAFEPSSIYKLWNMTRSDAEGRQEDAEEFLCFILNKLNDEMLEVVKLVNKPQAPKENGEADDDEDWQVIASNGKSSVFRQTDYGRTPLSDIFRGETRSRLQREGGMSKDAVQPFYTLQLNIEKAASVKEALDLLVGREQLEGFSCSKTNQEVVAWQQMTLEKLPVVLILHLKWFDYKGDGCSKILKNVEFPVELIIDGKIVNSKKTQKARTYRLFAVVYHDGKEATKGHYITDVYHPGYLNWLRFDDSSVKPIAENTVLFPSPPRVPYLLLYRRSDTFVPGQIEHHSTLVAHRKNNQK
ncbi:USP10 family protein [Megaselia abdita]